MAGIETAVEAARRYIIRRPRLTRLLNKANARVLMLIAPAGFGKTTLAREWASERPHVWYPGTTATADVAALVAGLSSVVSEVVPEAGARAVSRMHASGTPEQDVDILADLFAKDLSAWPEDTWLVFDDYQFAMEARAPERFVDLLLRKSPVKLLLASRKRPAWASAKRLLYGEVYELGRNELAMDHDEAAAVLAHRKDGSAAGLVALAEGWPAVIGLAALTEDFPLPERRLPDGLYAYFAEELYQAAPPDVRRGLTRIALAPSLGAGVAEFLLGDHAAEVISEGVRLGFLSARSGTLELHPLLRTFLDTKTREHTHENEVDARRLAGHLAEQGSWDDAFALVSRFFSPGLFATLLEQGLRTMLADARMATLERWIGLGESKRLDTPIIDLAQAEIAFHKGERRKSEALAVRAARRLPETHHLVSRAHYIAGLSAHLDYHNQRARTHCDRALATAQSLDDRRDAVWGQLIVSLDLDSPEVDALLSQFIDLDDRSALSDIRIADARFQVAVRRGILRDCASYMHSAAHVANRITEPHALSSFYLLRGALLVLEGDYAAALEAASRFETYAKDSRITFALPFARRIRALGELGLRHFSRCRQLVDWLDQEVAKSGDVFLGIEARLIRARLLIAQGLARRGVDVLREPPQRFPFEAERGEFLATLGLAHACTGNFSLALRAVDEAQTVSHTVEVRVLVPCIRTIVALEKSAPNAHDLAIEAFDAVTHIGNIDSFVVSYRGYPALLAAIALQADTRSRLTEILTRAQDWQIAKTFALITGKNMGRAGRALSPREREVATLIAQGLTNKEIAQTLFISGATAKMHVRHIFEKLGVRTRTEAALRFVEID